ncbi:hypothetical protein D3C80_1538490 [compost metagenome]
MFFRSLHQLLQVQLRGVRRHDFQLGGIAQQMVDLVVEDQRQAGQCQHQQKHGTDQAGPGVDSGPAANCFTFHFKAFRKTKAVHEGRPGHWVRQVKRLPLVADAGHDVATVAVIAVEAVTGRNVFLVEYVVGIDADTDTLEHIVQAAEVVMDGRIIDGIGIAMAI